MNWELVKVHAVHNKIQVISIKCVRKDTVLVYMIFLYIILFICSLRGAQTDAYRHTHTQLQINISQLLWWLLMYFSTTSKYWMQQQRPNAHFLNEKKKKKKLQRQKQKHYEENSTHTHTNHRHSFHLQFAVRPFHCTHTPPLHTTAACVSLTLFLCRLPNCNKQFSFFVESDE